GKNHGLAFDAHKDFVLGHLEIRHGHEFTILPRSPERRFVYKIGEVRAGKARSAARDDRKIHIVADGHFARVYAENFFAALHIGTRNDHAAIKAAGAQ